LQDSFEIFSSQKCFLFICNNIIVPKLYILHSLFYEKLQYFRDIPAKTTIQSRFFSVKLTCASAHPKPYCQAILMSSPHLSGNYVCFPMQCSFSLDEIFIFPKFILAEALFTIKSENEIFFVNLQKTS
jgi:hypothetical protein